MTQPADSLQSAFRVLFRFARNLLGSLGLSSRVFAVVSKFVLGPIWPILSRVESRPIVAQISCFSSSRVLFVALGASSIHLFCVFWWCVWVLVFAGGFWNSFPGSRTKYWELGLLTLILGSITPDGRPKGPGKNSQFTIIHRLYYLYVKKMWHYTYLLEEKYHAVKW